MASLDPTERAKIQLAAGDQVRISTTGQCTVQGLTGAPSSTTTLTASSQDFGPYGVSAVLLVTGVSGRTDYGLNNAMYQLTATEKRSFDGLVSGAWNASTSGIWRPAVLGALPRFVASGGASGGTWAVSYRNAAGTVTTDSAESIAAGATTVSPTYIDDASEIAVTVTGTVTVEMK